MRTAAILINNIPAGMLEEMADKHYKFSYLDTYQGPPVSLTMPINIRVYQFNHFPNFFEGLLPEGIMLEALLRQSKLDKNDLFGQLLVVGRDVVGAVSVVAMP